MDNPWHSGTSATNHKLSSLSGVILRFDAALLLRFTPPLFLFRRVTPRRFAD
jgi:hypothetical protein